MIDEKLCDEALQRFARTPDGTLFYLKLQKVLAGIPATTESGALQENLGRRRFAAELMAVMAEAMAEPVSDGSDDAKRRLASGERPVIFQLQRGVAVATGPRGARRRVADGS